MESTSHSPVKIRIEGPRAGVLTLVIEGRLDSMTTGKIWRDATAAAAPAKAGKLIIEASGIDYCDVSGIALLVYLRSRQLESGGQFEIRGLRPAFQELLDA